jgi:hypothetical protein
MAEPATTTASNTRHTVEIHNHHVDSGVDQYACFVRLWISLYYRVPSACVYIKLRKVYPEIG